MSNQNENLGGRLPLLDPKELAPAQAKLYKVMDNTLIGPQLGRANALPRVPVGLAVGVLALAT